MEKGTGPDGEEAKGRQKVRGHTLTGSEQQRETNGDPREKGRGTKGLVSNVGK